MTSDANAGLHIDETCQPTTRRQPSYYLSTFSRHRLVVKRGIRKVKQFRGVAATVSFGQELRDALGRVYEAGIINQANAMTPSLSKDPTLLQDWLDNGIKREIVRTYFDTIVPGVSTAFAPDQQDNLRGEVSSI